MAQTSGNPRNQPLTLAQRQQRGQLSDRLSRRTLTQQGQTDPGRTPGTVTRAQRQAAWDQNQRNMRRSQRQLHRFWDLCQGDRPQGTHTADLWQQARDDL